MYLVGDALGRAIAILGRFEIVADLEVPEGADLPPVPTMPPSNVTFPTQAVNCLSNGGRPDGNGGTDLNDNGESERSVRVAPGQRRGGHAMPTVTH